MFKEKQNMDVAPILNKMAMNRNPTLVIQGRKCFHHTSTPQN
jgi:hypothetical protein